LLLSTIIMGCNSDTADDGPLCSGTLSVTGASPVDGAQGVATDAHPSILVGNTTGCPLRSVDVGGGPVTVKLAGQAIDGTTKTRVEGSSAISTFIPSVPLMPNQSYTIEYGMFHASFATGTQTTSAPPVATTVNKVLVSRYNDNDEHIEVGAPFGLPTPIVHLIPTDADGKNLTAGLSKEWAFVVHATIPVGDAWGGLGIEHFGEICFVAQTENESGALSERSKPKCASP
jgi:hypothetical protein